MYGVAAEYTIDGHAHPCLPGRMSCRASMARQPGYRRRLALMADGWQRAVDLFLFTDSEMARAALTNECWCAAIGASPSVPRVDLVLLVSEGQWGEIVLLRGESIAAQDTTARRHDYFTVSEPAAVLW